VHIRDVITGITVPRKSQSTSTTPNINYAVYFPILARLFGTYHMPGEEWPEGHRIKGHPVPHRYFSQFKYPFQKLVRYSADGVRRRLVVFNECGEYPNSYCKSTRF
jgi:hypothetical protein